jgi:hypothetical protein
MHAEPSFQVLLQSIYPENSAGSRRIILEQASGKYMAKMPDAPKNFRDVSNCRLC